MCLNRNQEKLKEEENKKTNSVVLVRKRTTPTEKPPLVGEVSIKFADIGCYVVSAQIIRAVNFGFLDRSRYFLAIAPQLSSRG
jgi:hypothetical protein